MKLKELRKQKNLTQGDIAKFLNVAISTYRGYENKTSEPTIDTLKKIADYYGVTVDYLIEHETKGIVDLSSFSDIKKGCIYLLSKLNDKESAVVFGYITHILQDQSK